MNRRENFGLSNRLFNRVNFISHGSDRRRNAPDVLDSPRAQAKCSIFAPGAASFPQPAQMVSISVSANQRTLVKSGVPLLATSR
jgi:hypothetical protein